MRSRLTQDLPTTQLAIFDPPTHSVFFHHATQIPGE